MLSRDTKHFRNERDRLLDGAMEADKRGDKKGTDRIMREVRKAEAAFDAAYERDTRSWSESRWPERKRR